MLLETPGWESDFVGSEKCLSCLVADLSIDPYQCHQRPIRGIFDMFQSLPRAGEVTAHEPKLRFTTVLIGSESFVLRGKRNEFSVVVHRVAVYFEAKFDW